MVAAVGLLLAGCAAGPETLPEDPYESVNRGIYAFNETLDEALVEPVARGYRAVTPDPLERAVTNFFSNLSDVSNAANNLLQGKVLRAVESLARVAINSTIGIAGTADIAGAGIPQWREDFGQTLGVWGFGNGPYVVLPLLGASTVRDTGGRIFDAVLLDPVGKLSDTGARLAAGGTRLVDARANLLGTRRILEQAALDEYAFVRDAYLQRRRSLVHDGSPPPETE
ncbi:MAG: VacJ family lipoprotein [Ectothiorhodospiraceae bacterium]|nr:VacJ family lipoprotein [Ectothiorhodospiraceae bacterium]